MEVKVLNATNRPLDTIAIAAGTSYGKMDASKKRVLHCFNNGHMSVFEHASFTVLIAGISRACSHQLVRHRMASFCQLSQRYTKVNDENWFVTPPALKNADYFKETMKKARDSYQRAIDTGIKPEDARFLLPEATKTAITMTMNVRELYHFLDLRCDPAAQWEIRDLANEIKSALKYHNTDWWEIVALWEESNNE